MRLFLTQKNVMHFNGEDCKSKHDYSKCVQIRTRLRMYEMQLQTSQIQFITRRKRRLFKIDR
jgi:hypothetical protein